MQIFHKPNSIVISHLNTHTHNSGLERREIISYSRCVLVFLLAFLLSFPKPCMFLCTVERFQSFLFNHLPPPDPLQSPLVVGQFAQAQREEIRNASVYLFYPEPCQVFPQSCVFSCPSSTLVWGSFGSHNGSAVSTPHPRRTPLLLSIQPRGASV